MVFRLCTLYWECRSGIHIVPACHLYLRLTLFTGGSVSSIVTLYRHLHLNVTFTAGSQELSSNCCEWSSEMWKLHSSGLLRSECWQFITDVSAKPMGSIFIFLILGKWTDGLFRNVGKKWALLAANNPEERSSHLLRGGTWNHAQLDVFRWTWMGLLVVVQYWVLSVISDREMERGLRSVVTAL